MHLKIFFQCIKKLDVYIYYFCAKVSIFEQVVFVQIIYTSKNIFHSGLCKLLAPQQLFLSFIQLQTLSYYA